MSSAFNYSDYEIFHDEITGGPKEAKRVFVVFDGESRCHKIADVQFEEDKESKEVVCMIILERK